MIRFFLSYFLAMLLIGVCWHRLLNALDWQIQRRRMWKAIERRIQTERVK